MVRVCQRRSVSSSARQLGSTYRKARKPCTRLAHTKVRVSHTVLSLFPVPHTVALEARNYDDLCRCAGAVAAAQPNI